jgi:alginate O-acetyltransferase complex protein AlgI
MLFNSFEFLLFLPIVFILYWFVFNKKLIWQNALVLVASYFFYGWWSWKFMGLLMLSTLLDYTYGFSVASPNRKKAKFFLWLSIINNLGILGIFKYYNFFAEQFQTGLELLGLHTNPVLLNIALPVGISFYTFHGMSYVFDIYRGQQTPVRNFVDYAVFVSFFPLLVAGPIERASHLLPQVQKPRTFNSEIATTGISLMIWGFFKKVVIADNLALGVNDIFEDYKNLDSISLILGSVYFSFQIYCDFSGYTDIARGTARLFGFELLKNFDNPYLSESIPEFWKKWHMSLSGWFRDYLYFPLGGSKVGFLRSLRNVFLVFVISGFWHGANLTYIVWGLIHALFYIPGFVLKRYKVKLFDKKSRLTQILGIAATFSIVSFAWIYFRAPSISVANEYVLRMVSFDDSMAKFLNWRSSSTDGSHIEFIFVLMIFWIFWNVHQSNKFILKNALLILSILFFGMYFKSTDFIYFQF